MNTGRVAEAIAWAEELHAGQTRKGSRVPYLFHPLAVAAIVAEHGGGETEVIAALLHDAIEDGGGAPVRAHIASRFGAAVAAVVERCTDTDTTPKPPWRARKEAFVAGLADADPATRLVVAADKLHNARCTVRDLRREGEPVWGRFRGGRDGTLWYYRAVLEALAAGWTHPVLDELRVEVAALARLGDA